MKARTLSVERQDELVRLWNTSGWSQDAIAAHFGWKSRGILLRWVERLNLKPRRMCAPVDASQTE
jgi:hypothetical protein